MLRPIFALLCLFFLQGQARAESERAKAAPLEWSGAIGAGPIVFSKYTGSKAGQVWLIPQASLTYGDVAYIEPLRAGAYVWGSEDKSMGLGFAVEPRMGFNSGDGQRLTGMATRKNSLEAGPAFDWYLGVVALSFSWFTDLTHSSKGNSARLYVYREIVNHETWKLNAYVGEDWMSSRVANYFFGVPANEATPSRPEFQAKATANPMLGLDGRYKISPEHSLLFGLQATRLGSGVAASPIVETRRSLLSWLGFAWNL